MRDLARQHAPEAIEELARLALKAKNESARIAAIKELLDRGYGKPLQSIEAAGKDGGPIVHREITDEDRARALAVFIAKTRSVMKAEIREPGNTG